MQFTIKRDALLKSLTLVQGIIEKKNTLPILSNVLLDAKNGKVAIDGWSKLSHHDVVDLAQHFETDGVAAIVFTDVSRDGMMQGLNIESTVELAEAIHIPVIASGGVTNIDDIKNLCATDEEGIVGVIVGRALYEGTIELAEAQEIARKHMT